MNPKLSGYAQLHGELNYNATPLAPPGTKTSVHEILTVRESWEVHVGKGWYLGPSMEHNRCHHIYITETRGERDSEFVDFFTHNTPLLYKYSSENIIIEAHELAHALQNLAPKFPFSNFGDSQMVAIEQISDISP